MKNLHAAGILAYFQRTTTGISGKLPKLMKLKLFLIIMLALLGSCSRKGNSPGPGRLPSPPKDVGLCHHAQACPEIDWSFLGPVNMQSVKELALKLSPFAAEGNRVEEDEDVTANLRFDAVKAWAWELADQAKNGAGSLVRLKLTHCVGWGSQVPSTTTIFGCLTPWAVFVTTVSEPDLWESCDECEYDDRACREKHCKPWIVEGRFTGNQIRELKDPFHPESAVFSKEFQVFRQRRYEGKEVEPLQIDPALEIMLPAGYPVVSEPPVREGPVWAVAAIWDRVWVPASLILAQRQKDKLKAAGFSDAIILDSRRVLTQWCCSWIVVASRHDTSPDAQKARDRLHSAGVGEFLVIPLY